MLPGKKIHRIPHSVFDDRRLERFVYKIRNPETKTLILNINIFFTAYDQYRNPVLPSVLPDCGKHTEAIHARLEQKVRKQTRELKKQSRIIQMQAEKLKEAGAFHNLMMQYHCAIMEVETKLKVLNGSPIRSS